MTIRAPYLGHCRFDGEYFPVTNMASKTESQPLFYNVVVGLRDKCSVGSTKEDGGDAQWGTTQHQRRVWRRSPITPKASFSAPVFTVGTSAYEFISIFKNAIHGKKISGQTVYWHDGDGHNIDDAFINTFNLQVQAGEVASFSCDMTAKRIVPHENASSHKMDCSKLVTWDVCNVTSSEFDDEIQSFTININNPIVPIYTADNGYDVEDFEALFPTDLRIGIQEVTGSISFYGFNDDLKDVYDDTLTISVPGGSFSLYVTYAPSEASVGNVSGPVVYSVPFFGARGNNSSGGPVWISTP